MRKRNNVKIDLTLVLLSLVVSKCLIAAPVSKKSEPQFNEFPAQTVKITTTKKPIFSSNLARRYKTIISNSMADEPNFAGHYRVVVWGCGTDCRGFAIVDLLSGKTYTLPNLESVVGVMGNDEDRLSYRADSNLFVINGVKNEVDEGKFFYSWKNHRLNFLIKIPIKKEDFSN